MLWLRPEQARDILEQSRKVAPDEACGLLFGRGVEVTQVVRTRNAEPEPERGFTVAPEDLATALTRAARAGLTLVAVYHSHPTGRAIPSERDVREAHYPDAAQIIVGLGGSDPEIAAWRIDGGRVSRLELAIQANRPLPTDYESERMSVSQRAAIILAGLIAAGIVLVTAFALLPPPELPT